MSADMARRLAHGGRREAEHPVAGAPHRARRRWPMRCSPRWRDLDERVILIEDTRELQCAARDVVALRTRAVGGAARSRWPTLSARRCVCGPTGSSSAKCAAAKRSTCSKPGIPAIPAGLRQSMPTMLLASLYRLEQLIQESRRHRAAPPHCRGDRSHCLHRGARPRPGASKRSRASPASIPTAVTASSTSSPQNTAVTKEIDMHMNALF
jgi:hypothetical protein